MVSELDFAIIIEFLAFKQITTKRQVENQDEETNVDYIDENSKKVIDQTLKKIMNLACQIRGKITGLDRNCRK